MNGVSEPLFPIFFLSGKCRRRTTSAADQSLRPRRLWTDQSLRNMDDAVCCGAGVFRRLAKAGDEDVRSKALPRAG
jgi:hypothetical protein